MSERDLMTGEELAIAYAEMHLADHIEFSEDGERYLFTDAGFKAAWELWFNLSPKDRLTLFILTKLIIEAGANLDKKADI